MEITDKGEQHRLSSYAVINIISNGKVFKRKRIKKAPNSSRVKCKI